ncbi:GGDEF domain-containing protein [Vibrio agarivorans]|uniref:diguanylate cyclase n=1 Tax=Vibrio agarivorans TaxID=153622 RepID=A0ABT7Y5W3_9VIBR|nr:GGDEF domain-containing protein [Vibrio agarivorans]MDN2483390.1 GGDEF domain-containing protein [Vibrio agarivorans]
MDGLSLDIRTLNFIVILFSCTYAGAFILYRQSQTRTQGLKLFAFSLLCIGIGPFFLSFRGIAPDWFTIIVANTILITGFQLNLHSLCIFKQAKIRYTYIGYIALPIMVISLLYYTYFEPSIKYRVIVISCAFIVISLASAVVIYRGKRKDLPSAEKAMISAFGLYCLFNAIRAVTTYFNPEIPSLLSAGLVHQLAYLSIMLLVVTISFSMLWILNARLISAIDHLSKRDALTGLYNRLALDIKLPKLTKQAEEKQHPISIIMTDIDHFKSINDQHGHIVGDLAIQSIASAIQNKLPHQLSAFRYGGDELLIVLPEYCEQRAYSLAERLRENVADKHKLDAVHLEITSSFGVATLLKGETWKELISRADDALYRAKRLGRNRVVLCNCSLSIKTA